MQVLASAGDEGRLQLHYAGGNLMGTLPIDPNAPVLAPINSVAFSRGSKLLAAGCDDARIVIWDMKSQVRSPPGASQMGLWVLNRSG